jgi:hypothetical protein
LRGHFKSLGERDCKGKGKEGDESEKKRSDQRGKNLRVQVFKLR